MESLPGPPPIDDGSDALTVIESLPSPRLALKRVTSPVGHFIVVGSEPVKQGLCAAIETLGSLTWKFAPASASVTTAAFDSPASPL